MENNAYKMVKKISWWSIAVNLFLSVFKMIAGLLAKSSAMVSDAVHSASDVLTTFVVIIGVKMSGKAADKDHPYGHERMESIAGMILAIFLGVTGALIGYAGIKKIILDTQGDFVIPGMLALIAAITSIVIKEAMFWVTRHVAKMAKSTALMADAWHHRSDALSSVGSFIGIGGAMLGWPIMDPLASVVIALFILKAAYDVMKDAVSRVVDKACDDETLSQIETTVLSVDGVRGIDLMRSRIFGNRIYLDVEIRCDAELRLSDSHRIAEDVHQVIETTYPDVKHCQVHVNPHVAESVD